MIQTLSFTAGEIKNINVAGRFIRCLDATAAFTVRLPDGRETELDKGVAWAPFRYGPDYKEHFKALVLISSVVNSVELSIQMEEVDDNRMSGTVQTEEKKPSTNNSNSDLSVSSSTMTIVVAADTTRHLAILTALATNSAEIRINHGAAALQGIPLQPGESVSIPGTGAIYCYHENGVAEYVARFYIKD